MGSPTRDPYHNRSMEPRLSRDPPRESFNLMVVGEAGLGKTTLLESFFKSFKARRSAQPCLLCTAPARTGVGQGPLARATRDPSLSLPPRSHETPHVASLAPCRPRRVPLSPRASAAPAHPCAARLLGCPGRRRDLRPLRAEGDAQRHRDAPADRGGLCAAHRVRARHSRVSASHHLTLHRTRHLTSASPTTSPPLTPPHPPP